MGKKSNIRRRSRPEAFPKPVTIVETRNPPPADLDPSLHWYLVYTAPRMEAKAQKALDDAGCKTFWPSVHRVITIRKRPPIEHDVGTFPRYLFVAGMPVRERIQTRRISETEIVTVNGRPIVDIRDIDGVIDVVGTRSGWLRVPSAAIAAIAGYQEKPEPAPRVAKVFKPGQNVRIIEGPFTLFQAMIVEAIGLEADILIDIFGRLTRARMDVAQLDAA